MPEALQDQWRRSDPLPRARKELQERCGLSAAEITAIDDAVEEEVRQAVAKALPVARPKPPQSWPVYAPAATPAEDDSSAAAARIEPLQARGIKNGDAVHLALETILANQPAAFLAGMDIGRYGSAFKTCSGLIDRFGAERVIDMPICESGILGFALGASQIGARPIIEFQFADFSTEVGTQLGLNTATWFFRTGCAAPLLLRLPCGGGMTVGAFHSGEFEGLWSRFPGLKLLYPATPQETFEALVAGFHDPNPCLVLNTSCSIGAASATLISMATWLPSGDRGAMSRAPI